MKIFDGSMRRGADEFEDDDGATFLWPLCEIDGCQAYVCQGMSKSLCYPHGIEFGEFTKEEFERNRAARHPSL
jgi:hypothetical protein